MRWLASMLILAAFASPALAEAPRDKLKTTLNELQNNKEKAKELEAKLHRNRREVDDLREDATQLAEELQEAEARVTKQEREDARIAAKLAVKERDYASRKAEYASTLSSMLRMQRVPATALIAEPDNVHQVLRTTRAIQHVNGALAARAAQLRSETEKLERLRLVSAASKEKLSKETSLLTARQRRLDSDLKRRQVLQKQLINDVAAAQRKVVLLSQQSASLQDLIGKLERNKMVMASRGEVSRPIPASPSRGRWKVPVVGTLAHRYGQHKSSNETYRGLGFTTRPGAAVVAPAPGEIVFTGPFRDYGRMVLIKHGNDRISLLAGLGNIAVTLSETVGAGEPLGTMGNNPVPSLYYELREGGKPIDPSGWFANLGTRTARR